MRGLLELEEAKIDLGDKDNLMIVDAFNLAFRFSGDNFSADYLRVIKSLARSYASREVILVSDYRHSKFRRNIDPLYKDRGDKYANQTEEEKESIKRFFEGYERALELCKLDFKVLRFEYVEADDLAAYLVKNISDKFEHTWLISSDTDWDLLLRNDVSRFSFVTRKEYTVNNFYEYHGCDTPEEYISLKALKGDTGDNVRGVENVGEKRAYILIRQYGSALDIYDNIPLEGKQKFIQNINDSEELILKNYELMDLITYCEDAIAFPDENNLKDMEKFCNDYN